MSTAKELLSKLKSLVNAKFDDITPPAPPPPAPAAPPAGKVYTLQDGTLISIVQAGDTPAAGDMVTINGAPAPANTYILQDGSTLTTDATGTITAYTAAAPVTVTPDEAAKAAPPAPAPAPAPAPPAKFSVNDKGELDKTEIETMIASFATGDDASRIGNLEVVCRALMQYCYGWQIRENEQKAITDQAIEVYKTDLANAQFALAKQEKINQGNEEKIKVVLELCEQLAQLPTEDPKTIPESKKEKFQKQNSREARLEKMGNAIADLRTKNKDKD